LRVCPSSTGRPPPAAPAPRCRCHPSRRGRARACRRRSSLRV
jgi:hypothetical protein